MKVFNLKLGGLVSTFLTLSILPIRLSQGQAEDPINLIGSEIMIWIMCSTLWYITSLVFHRVAVASWQKIALVMFICAVFSNLFYYVTSLAFEDYPLKPMRELPLWLATLRLSIRGLLIGLIIVPMVFLLDKERRNQKARLEKERQRANEAIQQRHLLEALVSDRTAELQNTLSTLEASRKELDNQVYLLSRLVASITHDVNSPLKYITLIVKRINGLLAQQEFSTVTDIVDELATSLENISFMMSNLLTFSRGWINKESIYRQPVSILPLVEEKIKLFKGIVDAQKNILELDIAPEVSVISNDNLLAVIVHNLLDNATKFTRNGVIKISVAEKATGLQFVIENTLKEIEGNQHGAVNSYGIPEGNPMAPMKGHGIGLMLVMDIASLLDIAFFMEHTPAMFVARLNFADNQHQFSPS